MSKVHVSRLELRRLFVEHGVWEGLRRETYTCAPRDKVRVPVKLGRQPDGGLQVIHKWQDLFGRHVVTTHLVLDGEEWPVHWDEKDLVLEGVKYIHRKELDAVR